MRIGINLRYLQKTISGIERTILELLKEIDLIPGNHSFIGYLIEQPFKSPRIEQDLLSCRRLKLQYTRLPINNLFSRFFWDLIGVGRQAVKDKVDIFWGPSFSLPFGLRCPGVVSIYDLAFIHFPEAYDLVTRFWLRTVIPLSAHHAHTVITLSQNSKHDIIKFLRNISERVIVIPCACSEQFRYLPLKNTDKCDQLLRSYGIRKPFILTVSQLSPRKNLVHLIHVYASLRRAQHINHKLVIVGKEGWLYQDIYNAVKNEGIEEDVIFTGNVPDQDLVILYNTADIFAYLSLYEGFGMPVLEAMACGLPVITSNSSSLLEIVGNAGILIPPKDEELLAEAITRLSLDNKLKRDLKEKGFARAAQYNWHNSAKDLLEVFKLATDEHIDE